MRILIAGNSEALFIRPPRRKREDGTYTEILKRELPKDEIINLSAGSLMINDLLSRFNEDLYRYFPDVIILHFGINEAAPRMLPRSLWFYIYADRNKYIPTPFVKGIINTFRKILNKIAGIYLSIFGARGWMSLNKFEYIYSQLINRIDKELKSNIIIINIGPPSQRLEKGLPGISANITSFNKIIGKIAKKNDLTSLIDVHQICCKEGTDTIRPDGIHFNQEGHRLLATEILHILNLKYDKRN